jgi:hypothetical protein
MLLKVVIVYTNCQYLSALKFMNYVPTYVPSCYVCVFSKACTENKVLFIYKHVTAPPKTVRRIVDEIAYVATCFRSKKIGAHRKTSRQLPLPFDVMVVLQSGCPDEFVKKSPQM